MQFGYATREFEVIDERLGFYRPEEHVDNPRGYDSGSAAGNVTYRTGMKNYIANASMAAAINPTSAGYVEKQLVAAIARGRQGNEEAYIHLGAALHTLEDFTPALGRCSHTSESQQKSRLPEVSLL